VGWAGARQHAADLRLLEPVLRATWRDIDWVFLGMCPPELRPMAAEVHEMVPIARYPETLASLALDAAVAPLEDHPFNRAKSNLKLLEYGVLGIPVVASDLEPYRGAPVILVPARDADWIDAVRAYAQDREKAREAGQRLREWVASGRTLAGNIVEWNRALDPGHRAGGCDPSK
jgi:glycosyltransferase involved in cell wall biosynthesis